jgi:hypothetical protein
MANKEPRGQKAEYYRKRCPYQTKVTGVTEEIDVQVELAQRIGVDGDHGH